MSQAKRMVKHSSIYAIGNLSRQVVGFIMLPIYTRFLTPADYGVVGLLIFTVTLIELVFGARMFQAVPKFYYEQSSRKNAHAVISTALLITTAVSALTVLLVVLFRNPVSAAVFGTSAHGVLVGIFAVLVLTQALENYTLGYIRIQQRPWLFIGATSTKLVLQLSMNVWLVVLMEMGVMGVAISSAVSASLFTLVMTIYTLWNTGIRFSKHMAQRMLSFSWPLWLSGLAGLYIGSSNRYFIRVFGSLDEVGLFELAAKFGTIITVLVWMPFSQYWQTERFNLYQQSNPIPIYQTVFKLVSTVLILVALGVGIFSGPVIRIMAAPEFHSAAQAVPYLAFSAVFQCLVFFTNFSFLVKEKTSWMTWNAYITAAVVTIFYFTLIPTLGFIGAAQALMLANGMHFIIAHFAAKKQYNMRLHLQPLIVCLLVAASSMAFAYQLAHVNFFADLAIKSGIYLLTCVVVAGYLLSKADMKPHVYSFIRKQFS